LGQFVDREILPQVMELERRISETNENPRYVNRLGVLYAKYGKLDDAKVQFQKIIRSRPTANAYVNFGNLLYLDGDVSGALDQYEKAAALAPDNPTVLLSLAKAHHELQNYGFAERSYQQLAQLDPQLANQFRYLEFRGEEAARAAEAANVAGVMIWAEEE
jgi:tetratricopeptide (TPR) repeat protein